MQKFTSTWILLFFAVSCSSSKTASSDNYDYPDYPIIKVAPSSDVYFKTSSLELGESLELFNDMESWRIKNDLLEILLEYKKPSISALQMIRDSLGDNIQAHVVNRNSIYNILHEVVEITDLIYELRVTQNTLGNLTSDYVSNERSIKLIGSYWDKISVKDSILVNDYFKEPNSTMAIIRSTYDSFHTELINSIKSKVIKRSRNYTFEGTEIEQREYWNSLKKYQTEQLPLLKSYLEEFIKVSVHDFKSLDSYVKKYYPNVESIINEMK